MLWIIFPLAAALLYTLSSFVDNYLTDIYFKKRDPGALILFGIISATIFVVVMAVWRGVDVFLGAGTVAAIGLVIAGAIEALSNLPYYRALKMEDTTGVTILTQLYPVKVLILGMVVLGETISLGQTFAFGLILSAVLLLVFSVRTKRKFRLELRTGALAVLASLGWAVGDTIFVWFARGIEHYEDSYVWFLIGLILATLAMAAVKREWLGAVKEFLMDRRKHKMRIVLVNELLCIMAEMTFRAGLLMAPMALVGVVSTSSQLVMTFGLGILLTIIVPKFGREELERKHVVSHLAATVLTVIGIILIG